MNIAEVLKKRDPHVTEELSGLLNKKVPVIIAGAGNLGKKIASFLLKKNIDIFSFTDNNLNRRGETILGKTIFTPSEISQQLKEAAVWIVSIWSPGHSYSETTKQLQQSGVKNIFSGATLMQLYPGELLPHYHFQTPDFYLQHKQEITEVFENLADEESKRQFLAHADARINLNFEGLPKADISNQYFPSGVVSLGTEEVFLDAGAFDGDTLKEFVNRTGTKFSKYIALEPDPANYEKLLKVASQYPKDLVEVFPYAVGAENTTLKFNATGGGGAGFSETGTTVVECKKIDDVFFKYKPTYLKFDIEGAELDALKGAQKTIEAYKPKLAVCIYHLPQDIWQIFLFLRQKFSFYKFYVRTHQYDGLDFVLYAIPQ